MGSDHQTGLTGLSGEPEVGELCDVSANISEGCSNTKIKKKNNNVEMVSFIKTFLLCILITCVSKIIKFSVLKENSMLIT